jgi:hypothetical protein
VTCRQTGLVYEQAVPAGGAIHEMIRIVHDRRELEKVSECYNLEGGLDIDCMRATWLLTCIPPKVAEFSRIRRATASNLSRKLAVTIPTGSYHQMIEGKRYARDSPSSINKDSVSSQRACANGFRLTFSII